MGCRGCQTTFDVRRARRRASRGTGGSSSPTAVGAVAAALALGAGIAWRWGSLAAVPLAAAACVATGAWWVAFGDTHNAVCPQCGLGGHTAWPWRR